LQILIEEVLLINLQLGVVGVDILMRKREVFQLFIRGCWLS
jgi:hypothetical protein